MRYVHLRHGLMRHKRVLLWVALLVIAWHAFIMPMHQAMAALQSSHMYSDEHAGHIGHMPSEDAPAHDDSLPMAPFCTFCQSISAYSEIPPVRLAHRIQFPLTYAVDHARALPLPRRYTPLNPRGPPVPFV